MALYSVSLNLTMRIRLVNNTNKRISREIPSRHKRQAVIEMVFLHDVRRHCSKTLSLLISMVNLPKSVHAVCYMGVHVDPVCLDVSASDGVVICFLRAVLIEEVFPSACVPFGVEGGAQTCGWCSGCYHGREFAAFQLRFGWRGAAVSY